MRKVRKEYLFFVLFVESSQLNSRSEPSASFFWSLFSLFFLSVVFSVFFFFFDLFFIHHRVSIRPSSLFFAFFFAFFCFFERFLTRFFPSLLFVFFLSPEKKLKKVFVVVVGT